MPGGDSLADFVRSEREGLKEDCACGRLMSTPRCTLLLGGGIHTGQANVCKIVHMQTTLKLKINMLRAHLGLNIYLLNPSTGLPNLMRLSLSILLFTPYFISSPSCQLFLSPPPTFPFPYITVQLHISFHIHLLLSLV
jgi:hypothetical protein